MHHLLLLLLVFIVLHILSYFLTDYQKFKKSARSKRISSEIAHLRRRAKDTFSPSTFAASAKLDRQADKLEKQKEQLTGLRDVPPYVAHGLRAAKVLAYTVPMYFSWKDPIAMVPSDLVDPMFKRMSFPYDYGQPGALADGVSGISMFGWLFLCDRLANGFVSALDSAIVF
eukprot:TRINITY_DN28665_c0_g1_i1.p2 TRINITY_DN28665_c0_g1~~TRINITY_DN28665_c0_g1_i1.p2  ORF type:complete len:191 (-),score=12.79 TRINITY_DN28665_c0_g1_i1:138-650(-)